MNAYIIERLLALPDRLDRIEAFLLEMRTDMNANEKALIDASDALLVEVDDLGGAYDASLARIDDLTAALAAKTASEDTPDEVAQIQAETAKMRGKVDAVRSKVAAVQVAKTSVDTSTPAVTASAATAPAVALAGVPVTPDSESTGSAAGPAVPSVDGDVTDASPNKDTSSPAPTPSGATAEVSGS